jgi:NAD(P)-dependent dehydrogenase (short-subunit alcohol dehydrogenase family)
MTTVLITGASTGIGAACALDLARRGHRVYAGVRKDADGERLAGRAGSDNLRPVIIDVTRQDTIEATAARIRSADGGLDGLVNNAGIGRGGPVEFLEVNEWREQFEVNVFGQIAVTQAMLPLLRERAGRVVFIGSIGGRVATMMTGPYNASKFAIEGLGEALRQELRPWGLSVSIVEPGAIKTEIWGKAHDVVGRLEKELPREAVELYAEQIDLARKALAMQDRQAVPAQKVADAVRHALTAGRPRPRYLVGVDAHLQAAMARWLPDRARDALLRLALSRA